MISSDHPAHISIRAVSFDESWALRFVKMNDTTDHRNPATDTSLRFVQTVKQNTLLSVLGLRFPSDTLTIGRLRSREPGTFFDMPDWLPHLDSHIELMNSPTCFAKIRKCEIIVAMNSFARSRGERHTTLDRDEISSIREQLSRMYIDYELAPCLQAARQLIREIERMAKSLGHCSASQRS